MKRITSIQLENFRAFYGLYDPILLPNGENLLLYGENGSGKSSFFKAIKHYFQSSRQPALVFEENTYAAMPLNGTVRINFVDVDPLTRVPIAGSDQLLSFRNGVSDNNVQFIQDADLVKGFFDYRSLLRVYSGPNNNLFELIVDDILYDHIPIGEVEPIGVRFANLSHTLQTTDRRFNEHWEAIDDLPLFEAMLRNFLDRLFLRLNGFLIRYFKINLRVAYVLQPIEFDHDFKVWNTTQDLKLSLTLNGQTLINHNEYLNEAKLSALAICLYLASLKQNPAAFDYKILFLDDVFIGLDTSNRNPILKIIREQFSDYQVFITTYDKHWYEMAQRYFINYDPGKWLFDNLYVGTETVGNTTFDKPILIQGDDDYTKGVYYLHHPDKPDYPAAANYFRKYAEYVLSDYLPPGEIRNEDYSLIENYKLTSLVNSGLHFLNKIGADNVLVTQLDTSLPSLLHPLSHFNLSSPVYKGELQDIQKCLMKLKPFLIALKDNYRVFIPQGKMFKLNFTINATDSGHYDIYTKEPIYLLRGTRGAVRLSDGKCHCKTCYTNTAVGRVHGKNFNNNDPTANYTSVENAYATIRNVVIGQPGYGHIPLAADYTTEFTMDDGAGWQQISVSMVW